MADSESEDGMSESEYSDDGSESNEDVDLAYETELLQISGFEIVPTYSNTDGEEQEVDVDSENVKQCAYDLMKQYKEWLIKLEEIKKYGYVYNTIIDKIRSLRSKKIKPKEAIHMACKESRHLFEMIVEQYNTEEADADDEESDNDE
jgi:hypothetical protein